MTLRDDAWNCALVQIVKTGKFKISDLPFNDKQRHTVRRVLREMEEYDWLRRDAEHAAIWRAGGKAELLLRMSDDSIDRARE